MTERIEPILWEHWLTGHPDHVAGRLTRSIGQYLIDFNRFYVGRTKDPWTRMSTHRRNWRRKNRALYHMIEIYKTKSFANMVRVEALLIEKIKANVRRDRKKVVLNKAYGDWQNSDYFYLYLLVDDGSKKTSLSDDVDDGDMIEKNGLATSKDNMKTMTDKIKIEGDKNKFIYLGFTDDPKTRFKQHQETYSISESWSKMFVLFEGKNLSNTYEAENLIIKYGRDNISDDVYLNVTMRHEEKDFYYVYVLVGNK